MQILSFTLLLILPYLNAAISTANNAAAVATAQRTQRDSPEAKKKENLFISADVNGDSRVDMQELADYVRGDKFWKSVWAVEGSDQAIAKYKAFFTPDKLVALDLNRDGKVDDPELRKYSLEYIKEWMDIDRDGFIVKWEFEMNMNILMGNEK